MDVHFSSEVREMVWNYRVIAQYCECTKYH